MNVNRLLASLVAFLLLSSSAIAGGVRPKFEALFLVRPWQTNPVSGGITLAMTPGETMDLRCKVMDTLDGENAVEPTGCAQQLANPAGTMVTFDVRGLTGWRGFYRIEGRRSASEPWRPYEAHRWIAQAPPNVATKVVQWSDGHSTSGWANSGCSADNTVDSQNENLTQTKGNLADVDPDLVLITGDSPMCHVAASGFDAGCSYKGQLTGSSGGSAISEAECRARYIVWLDAVMFPICADRPCMFALGNHDTVPAWMDSANGATGDVGGYLLDSRPLYDAARLSQWPNPNAVYGNGNAEGSAFYFDFGNARYIVNDPYTYTTTRPRSKADCALALLPDDCGADDWAYGTSWTGPAGGQRAMISAALAGSTLDFQIGLSHSPAGGINAGFGAYHYARFSLLGEEITPGDNLGWTLLGQLQGQDEQWRFEQFRDLLGEVILFGHDHLTSTGEKLNPDGTPSGVFYIVTGQPRGDNTQWRLIGGTMTFEEGSPNWQDQAAFSEWQDYDRNGRPDYYDTGGNATVRRGFSLLNVPAQGGGSILYQFIASDRLAPWRNGEIDVQFSIPKR